MLSFKVVVHGRRAAVMCHFSFEQLAYHHITGFLLREFASVMNMQVDESSSTTSTNRCSPEEKQRTSAEHTHTCTAMFPEITRVSYRTALQPNSSVDMFAMSQIVEFDVYFHYTHCLLRLKLQYNPHHVQTCSQVRYTSKAAIILNSMQFQTG